MKLNGERICRRIIAILILSVLIITEFAFTGITVVSYAIDMFATNSDNVQFCAYFVDDEQSRNVNVYVNEIIKMNVEVLVVNEGYLDGKILFEDANFEINKVATNEYVKEVKENEIYLNRINAGEKVIIETEVKVKYNNIINTNYLSQESNVVCNGVYVSSKNTTNIDSKYGVTINWKLPENTQLNLDAELLTNFNYTEGEQLLQFIITTNIQDNIYPVKENKISLILPEGSNEVKVHKRSTMATNGNEKFNYLYNNENRELTISTENSEEDGKINWEKTANDIYVVTCKYNEKNDLLGNKIEILNEVTAADMSLINKKVQLDIDKSVDGIITSEIIEKEEEIYKGKIYTGEEREYQNIFNINVNNVDYLDDICIYENTTKYISEAVEKKANIYYTENVIEKKNFLDIFGQDGWIIIKDSEGNVIYNVNAEYESDENGYIHLQNTEKSLILYTSKPISEGTLKIYNKMKIQENNYQGSEIKEFTNIVDSLTVKNRCSSSKEIKLLEPDTKISMNLEENASLKIGQENQILKMRVNLENNDESKSLYENPTVTVVLPKYISNAEMKCNLLYGNGLEIKKAYQEKTDEGIKVIVELEGEQKLYNDNMLNSTAVLLYAYVDVISSVHKDEGNIKALCLNQNISEDKDETTGKIKFELSEIENKLINARAYNESIDNLEVQVYASVGDDILENNSEVKAGEIITYTVNIRNSGNVDAENVLISANAPDFTRLVEYDLKENTEELDEKPTKLLKYLTEKNVQHSISKIRSGEKATYSFMAEVNEEIEDNKNLICSVKIKNGDTEKNVEITNIAKKSNISIQIKPVYESVTDVLQEGHSYLYIVTVKNISENVVENINSKIILNNVLEEKCEENNESKLNINIEKINVGEKYEYRFSIIPKFDVEETKGKIYGTVLENGNISKSNFISYDIGYLDCDVTVKCSTNSKNEEGYLELGDEVTYTINIKNTGNMKLQEANVYDYISKSLVLKEVSVNGKKDAYREIVSSTNPGVAIDADIDVNGSMEIVVKATVNENLYTSELIEVNNELVIYDSFSSIVKESQAEKKYIKSIKTENVSVGETPGNNDANSKDEKDNNNSTTDANNAGNQKYYISGMVWLDTNKNGKKDQQEENIKDIKIYAVDSKTGKKVSGGVVTNSNGTYTLSNLNKGNYLVVFEYDTSVYSTTIFKVDGVSEENNSNAESMELLIDGKKLNCASTNEISLKYNVENVNLGLVKKQIFDLELNKYVSKITVTNKGGTSKYEFNKSTLAKAEIASKYINGSSVVIEYNIEVKNTGNVPGYVTKIADYLPNSLTFNSKLNSNWYKKDNTLYNESLQNTIIQPGETKKVKLILTMSMTNSNTGLLSNNAEIIESKNNISIKDIDSVNGNKNQDEDDYGTADVIITVKTGEAKLIITIFAIIGCGILADISIYIIYKKRKVKA